MHLLSVDLTVPDVAVAADFFARTLDLPVERDHGTAEVVVGSSRVRLTPGPAGDGVHHLAFDVAPGSLAAHRSWLEARVPLLASAEGVAEFEGPATWNSRSVYFSGPADMVLELIERRSTTWPDADGRVPALRSLSEVGVAVPDVAAAIELLGDRLGVHPYGEPSPEFAAVGDVHGLLILVTPGRGWLPTFAVRSAPLPLEVVVAGPDGVELALGDVARLRTGG